MGPAPWEEWRIPQIADGQGGGPICDTLSGFPELFSVNRLKCDRLDVCTADAKVSKVTTAQRVQFAQGGQVFTTLAGCFRDLRNLGAQNCQHRKGGSVSCSNGRHGSNFLDVALIGL